MKLNIKIISISLIALIIQNSLLSKENTTLRTKPKYTKPIIKYGFATYLSTKIINKLIINKLSNYQKENNIKKVFTIKYIMPFALGYGIVKSVDKLTVKNKKDLVKFGLGASTTYLAIKVINSSTPNPELNLLKYMGYMCSISLGLSVVNLINEITKENSKSEDKNKLNP